MVPDYISVKTAANETACSPQLIRAAIKLGNLSAVRFNEGRTAPFFVDRFEVHQWAQHLKDRTSGPSPDETT